MCREIQMGVAAAQRAMTDAGWNDHPLDPDRTGVLYGSDYILTTPDEFVDSVGKCLDEHGKFDFNRWAEEGLPRVAPLWLLKYLPNMPASHIAIYNDLRGPNNSLTLREASANLAVSEAYLTINRGSADCLVTGATGTRVHAMRSIHVTLQESLANGQADADPTKQHAPFDKNRHGQVMGEGAGAIVLEELEYAQKRGATILGEVVGFGSSTVAETNGTPRFADAFENTLRAVLRSAGASADDVGHLHAHGLASLDADREEAAAIQRVFGDRQQPVPVVAAKSYFGNLGAGSGLVELACSLLALEKGTLFPTLAYETPDPECNIAVVTNDSTPAGDSFVSINISPQGQASGIMVKRFEG
jgi:3-oxoacyl-[acyl-carrier-protein] synthase II